MLFIERSDGLGFCFPGGLCRRGEGEIDALKRELQEETGLTLTAHEKLFSFECYYRFPHFTTVYEGRVHGQLRASWEGSPRWLTLEDAAKNCFPGQIQVLQFLLNSQGAIMQACRYA